MLISKQRLSKVTNFFRYSSVERSLRKERFVIQVSRIYDKYKHYTMVPKQIFVENLKLCHSFKHVKGCIVECGVWRGGMSAAISELLGKDRNYYLFDSFEGLPKAQLIDGESAINWQENKEGHTYYDNCKAEIDYAYKAMEISKAEKYQVIKGWFSETLPKFNTNEEIAILRLDGDWYNSTMECLTFLYPTVSKGGLIIIDDYYAWEGCSRAVHDYLSAHSLPNRIYQFNQRVCYIVKT